MATREDLENCLGDEQTFKLRKIAGESLFKSGLMMQLERLTFEQCVDEAGAKAIRALLTIATKEEQVFDYPANWFQAFKERCFPRWLKKKIPVRMNRVWAIHLFPELNIPNEFVGREYVSFRVVNVDRLEKLADKKEKELVDWGV